MDPNMQLSRSVHHAPSEETAGEFINLHLDPLHYFPTKPFRSVNL